MHNLISFLFAHIIFCAQCSVYAHFILFFLPVPRQTNSWDCGLFTCKYAHALYQQRWQMITVNDLRGKKPLINVITNSPYMKFDYRDIDEMRVELRKLIDNLSDLYHGLSGVQLSACNINERNVLVGTAEVRSSDIP